jgi:transglutaminase-like putative cysteine protease
MNWLKLVSNSIIIFLIFVSPTSVFAQSELLDYKKNYPNVNEIIVNDIQSYDFSIENKKIKVIQNNLFESMILNENGIQNNQESFSYSELVKLIDYEAHTIITEKGKEKKIKVTQTNEKQARQSSVFYNDVKERQLIFPNLEAGAKKVFNYQTEFVDPFLLHKFIFGNNLPILNSSLEVIAEKNINIGYKIFNDPTNQIEFSKTEKKGKWIYKWTYKKTNPLKYEENSPGFLHQITHIDVYIKDYTINEEKIEVLDDVDKLFNYYKGFVKNLNQKSAPELKQLTEELTANLQTDEEKIKSIFYWVKTNIKYIAFENGYEGFIPREASLVFERKFGDCKDMASIITAMADYANIQNVTISWIGTRTIPYAYNELATPSVDNHMIAVFKKGADYIFLDGTDKETRFGIPTAFIQGKQALFSENGTYKIVSVPIVPAETNEINEVVKLSIEKNKIIGSGKIAFNGFSRSSILMQIGDVANKTRFEMIKSLVLKGNNKFSLIDFSEENITDRDLPYVVNFNFDLDNYLVKVDKELYLNLYLEKYYEKLIIEKNRVAKFEFEFLTYTNTTFELTLPKNYSLKYIPKNFSLDSDYLKADFTYEVKNEKIILHCQLKQKKIILDNKDFELWNLDIKKLKTNYSETLILLEN